MLQEKAFANKCLQAVHQDMKEQQSSCWEAVRRAIWKEKSCRQQKSHLQGKGVKVEINQSGMKMPRFLPGGVSPRKSPHWGLAVTCRRKG